MEKFFKPSDKKNFVIVLIIFLFLVLSTVLYICFFDYSSNEENLEINQNKDVPMTEVTEFENVVEEGPLSDSQQSRDVNDDDFTFTINKSIIFKNASSLGNVKIENPKSNKYDFYVEIKLKNKDEVVYKSPILEPNQHITNDYLMVKLNKGSYESVATIFVIDKESNEIVAQENFEVTIKIKK